jgi:hypothetical protein
LRGCYGDVRPKAETAAIPSPAQRTRFQLRRPSERKGGVCCKPELGGGRQRFAGPPASPREWFNEGLQPRRKEFRERRRCQRIEGKQSMRTGTMPAVKHLTLEVVHGWKVELPTQPGILIDLKLVSMALHLVE